MSQAQRTLRKATEREQAIHDAFVKQIEKEVERIGPDPHPAQIMRIVQKVGRMAKRYGWAQGGAGVELLIDEQIVWDAIQEANPVPDILEKADDHALAWSRQQAIEAIRKAAKP